MSDLRRDADDPLYQRPSALRRAAVPICFAVVSVAAMGWVMWGAFEGQREDVATTRAFLNHIAANEHEEAVDMMSPLLASLVNSAGLAQMVGDIEPWDHIGFSSRSTSSDGLGRSTSLLGTGEAISGCESALSIQVDNGQISAFNMAPLCSAAGGTDL